MGRRFGRARAVAIDITPLRESVPYRALWLGQLLSQVGTQMRFVAVPYQVYEITRSTVMVGLLGLVEVVPLIVFSLAGGALADSMDRKKLTALVQGGLMVASGALAWVSFAVESPSLWGIFVLTGVSSAFSAVERPARTAMAPSLVAPEQFPAIMALRQVVIQTTQIAGPAVAGILISVFARRSSAHDAVGWVYLIDCLTFVAALVSLRWIPEMEPRRGEREARTIRAQREAIAEGVRFSVKNTVILPVFVIDLVAMIFGMPRAVFPALAQRSFGGADALGLLYAAPAVGALIGALTTGWVKRVRRQGLAVIVAVALWGAAITLAGLSLFSFALTLLLLAFAGAADVVSAVFRGTILLDNAPDEMRARVFALQLMVVTSGPRLGDVEAGLVAGAVGAPASIVIGGLASLVGTAWVATTWSKFRRYEGPTESERPARAEDAPDL